MGAIGNRGSTYPIFEHNLSTAKNTQINLFERKEHKEKKEINKVTDSVADSCEVGYHTKDLSSLVYLISCNIRKSLYRA